MRQAIAYEIRPPHACRHSARNCAGALDRSEHLGGERLSSALWLAREGVFSVWPGATLSAALLIASALAARRADPHAGLAAWRNAALAMLSLAALPIWGSLALILGLFVSGMAIADDWV